MRYFFLAYPMPRTYSGFDWNATIRVNIDKWNNLNITTSKLVRVLFSTSDKIWNDTEIYAILHPPNKLQTVMCHIAMLLNKPLFWVHYR